MPFNPTKSLKSRNSNIDDTPISAAKPNQLLRTVSEDQKGATLTSKKAGKSDRSGLTDKDSDLARAQT